MATIFAPGVSSGRQNRDKVMAHVYGNAAVKRSKVTLPVGTAVADIVNFMVLPKDVEILDFTAFQDGANSAASTMNIGLKAANTPAPSPDQSDADYFLAAYDLNAAGRTRWGNLGVYGITLNDDYYVQGVLAGANIATAACIIELTVWYEYKGS